MLDAAYFSERFGELESGLQRRGMDLSSLARLRELSETRRKQIHEVEKLRSQRNEVSAEIAKLKRMGTPESQALANEKVEATRLLGEDLRAREAQLTEVQNEVDRLALHLPNIPHASVPEGATAEENREVRRVGTVEKMSFTPKDHATLGEQLKIVDFERGGKLSGARFSVYLEAGASLERALIQFMLDTHTREHGYTEVIPPFMVTRGTMTMTGNLPKFESDLFKTGVDDRELFLIPTAEVPLTALRSDEILLQKELPLCLTAYSPCFRSEAGSYGKDVRGLIRQHQFQKVELVKLSDPERSHDELESMVRNAETILERLELPYRTMLLCAGDMGFSSMKTYDIEVWLPSQNAYREISSCSNCGDFQARRAKIRFKTDAKDKARFVHTLNGSGLAVGRTFVAILENFQDSEGGVRIPRVLERYLEGAPGFNREHGALWIRPKNRSGK